MFSLLRKSNSKLRLIVSELKESNENRSNPGRGWYRLHTFLIEAPVIEEELEVVCCKEEQIAMVQIDLGNYRNTQIDQLALHNLKLILEFFRKEKKELILRFLYDREGKGMEHEPSGIHIIQTHMRQVGLILREYSEIILTLQGLFVGSWGEMHNSKFLSKSDIEMLAQTLQEATADSCRMAVRKPQYLRMLFTEDELTEHEKKRNIGLYNDGMLASESDLGTYGTSKKSNTDWEDAWCREDELEFQNSICQTVLNGGEVIGVNPLSDMDKAITELQRMHVTYLHSLYDLRVLEKWKNTSYHEVGTDQGVNGYDYIGAHLGYRFFIKEVSLVEKKKKQTLIVKVSNSGFANAYEEMQVIIFLKEEDVIRKTISVPTDVRNWSSNGISTISIELENLEDCNAQVWLQIIRVKDQRSIWLANVGAGEAFMLGRFFCGKTAKEVTK